MKSYKILGILVICLAIGTGLLFAEDYTHKGTISGFIDGIAGNMEVSYNLRIHMGEPVKDGVYRYSTMDGSKLHHETTIYLKCKKETDYNEKDVFYWVPLSPTVPKSGKYPDLGDWGYNTPGSPDWGKFFLKDFGGGPGSNVWQEKWVSANEAKEFWKNGFRVTGFTVVTSGGKAAEDVKEEKEKIYKIGDKGPAGGIVFYDKGNYSEDWRYLEAAPNDIGRYDYENALNECWTLGLNGHSDWRLPTLKELGYMYTNLYKKGLGSFSASLYWSKTPYHYLNAIHYYAKDFSTGGSDVEKPRLRLNTRPIRAFGNAEKTVVKEKGDPNYKERLEAFKKNRSDKKVLAEILKDMPFLTESVNVENAKQALRLLGANRIYERVKGVASGDFGDNLEITIWSGTYGKTDRYGIRYGGLDGKYWGSNDTYFEIKIH